MLIAQDFISFFLHFSFFTYWTYLERQFGWDLKLFENFDSSEFIFFLSEGLSEAFIRCETLLHSAFIFQIGRHVSDAVCRVMYGHAWMKCSYIGFHFMFFLFIKFATFLLVHTSQACWCSSFLLCLRKNFYLDTCLSRRILLFVLGDILFQTFQYKTHGFSSLRSGLYHSGVVTKFRMNNEKLLMQMQLI